MPAQLMHWSANNCGKTQPDMVEGGNEKHADATGAEAHYRALESLYAKAPVNRYFESHLSVTGKGKAEIRFLVNPELFHAAGAAHGTLYFKMLDDAAFYAANSLVTDHYLLTTAFNLHFTKPVKEGELIAMGHWVSGKKRILVAESRLIDSEGDEIARGTGTFMRSRIALSGLPGYQNL